MTTKLSFQTLFAKGGGHSLAEQSTLGYEVIGVDWTVDPVDARTAVGPNVTLQGNLDPQHLYLPKVIKICMFNIAKFVNIYSAYKYNFQDELTKLTEEMVRKFGKHRYIANLGHGITPLTPIESMTIFSETVHSTSDKL